MQKKAGGVVNGGEGGGGGMEEARSSQHVSRVLVQRNAAGNMVYVFR